MGLILGPFRAVEAETAQDPLENGIYLLRLEATDVNGASASTEVPIEVEGDAKIGVMRLSFVDLVVPAAGVPITVTRTYDSRVKTRRDFGVGWTLEVSAGHVDHNRAPGVGWSITQGPPPFGFACSVVDELVGHTTTVHLSDREWYSFAPSLTNLAATVGACLADVEYHQIDGWSTGATLDLVGGASVIAMNGNDLVDETTGLLFNPSDFVLTTPDGRQVTINAQRGVTHIEDLNHNAVTISATGILQSAGTSVAFGRDASGRIASITDPNGGQRLYTYSAEGDLVRVEDQAGSATTFTYDGRHNLEEIYDPLGIRAARSEYDASGRLIATIDAHGSRTEIGHDLSARRETVTNRLGYTTTLEYDIQGNVTRETYPGSPTVTITRTFDTRGNKLTETNELGQVMRWTYDSRNLKLTETNALTQTSTWTYTPRGRVASFRDASGALTTYEYDNQANLLAQVDPEGFRTTYARDERGLPYIECDPRGGCTRRVFGSASGAPTRVADPRNIVTRYTYDASGALLTETTTRAVGATIETLVTTHHYDPAGREVEVDLPSGAIERTEYDPRGLVSARVDPLGARTELDYDAEGRQVGTRYPDGSHETTGYDAEGRVVSRTDRDGRTQTMSYDDRGRLLDTTATGYTTHFGYDLAGRMTSETDRRGNSSTRTYDATGRVLSLIDPLGHATTRAYDAAGRLVSITDAKNHTTQHFYDRRGFRVRTRFIDGTEERSEYDAAGNETARIDASGRRTEYGFDGAGNLTSVRNPNNETWTYGYDEASNLRTITDPLGHATTVGFDAMGRETSRRYAIGNTEQRTYDLVGNLATKTSRMGLLTSYAYDPNRRLISRIQPEGTVTQTWTGGGQRITVTDARGTTTYGYDANHELGSVTEPSGNALSYGRDADGNITSMSVLAGGQTWTETYAYDRKSRITSVTSAGATFTLDYDATDHLAALHMPSGVVTSYGYDVRDRLASIETRNAGNQLLMRWAYTRSGAGDILTSTDEAGRTHEYSYDPAGRLTEDVVRTSTAVLWAEGFAYDSAGNRTIRYYSPPSGATVTDASSYDARDRLTSAGAATLSWDEDGRMLSRSGAQGYTLGWDSQDRLLSVQYADGSRLDNTYDADGVRVGFVETPASGTATVTNLLVTRARPLSHVVAELTPQGALRARYLRAADKMLAVFRGSDRRDFVADQIGSTRALLASGGAVTDRWEYFAFGAVRTHSGADGMRYLFAGEPFESRGLLSQNRARWLELGGGSFVSIDPASTGLPAPPDLLPQQDALPLRSYVYADLDPVSKRDPTGLETFAELQITAGVAETIAGRASIQGVRVGLALGQRTGAAVIEGTVSTSLRGAIRLSLMPRLGGLRLLHTAEALSRASFQYLSKLSTQQLIASLAPGATEALTISSEGVIMQGGTRVLILLMRGVDITTLPFVLHVVSSSL